MTDTASTANPGKPWQETQCANLIRYIPAKTYFARVRVGGKLIRKFLKTDVLSIDFQDIGATGQDFRGFARLQRQELHHGKFRPAWRHALEQGNAVQQFGGSAPSRAVAGLEQPRVAVSL